MKPFSRTVEKVLAWIANVLLILLTGALVYIVFFKTELIRNNPDIIQQAEQIFASNPKTANLTPEQRMDLMIASFITYVVIYIIVTILTILGAFLMKKPVLSGVFFLLAAIAVGVTSVGLLIPIYLLHLIVAIMLFVRKEPTTEFPEQQGQQETISYL
ncbi:DUF4064 domain-containing protein [Gemella sp. 27098_8_92]|uniref:DUF4064 domain-containing protein n=1 Tax=Gemella sp. 27098_8_92 TaxID=3003687 RepID=UPI00352D5964